MTILEAILKYLVALSIGDLKKALQIMMFMYGQTTVYPYIKTCFVMTKHQYKLSFPQSLSGNLFFL